MREVFMLVGWQGEVLWHDTDYSPVHLDDNKARWDAIWEHRADLALIAHSHPVGPNGFSSEDESTMDALDTGLGKELTYAVVGPKTTVFYNAQVGEWDECHTESWMEPEWIKQLRQLSDMPARTGEGSAT